MNMTIRFEALVPGIEGDRDLDALRGSIKAEGLLLPLTVEPLGEGRFKVVEGNSRYYSMQSLMQTDEPVWDGHSFRPASSLFASITCIVR